MLRISLFDRGGVALAGLALAALTVMPADAARRALPVREAARVAALEFRREQPRARLEVDARTGLVRSLSHLAPVARPAEDSVTAAGEFLARHKAMLLGDRSPEEMVLEAVEPRATATRLTYQQQYRGLPVWGARFSVHLDARRQVRLAQGTVRPEINLDTAATISAEAAIRRAWEAAGSPVLRAEPQAALGVLAEEGPARLAYRVELAAVPPADWRIFVDADSGEVIERLDLLRHAGQMAGEGLVFEENPFTTPDLLLRPLPGLKGDGVLKGQFVDVGSFDRVDGGGRIYGKRLSRSEDHRFVAEPADPRFDEQMLYYHVTRMHGFLRGTFGFTGRDHALPVVAHMPELEDLTHRVLGPLNNAYFSPLMDALFFGSGTGRANGGINATSRDADVIYHEYSHAAIHKIVPNLGGETRYNVFGAALDEGYSDYLACALNDNPAMGEYTVAHPEGLRNLVNNRRYPQDVNHPRLEQPQAHWTGQIWGGACWELRGKLGAEVTDRIVFQSLYYLPQDGTATLPKAATALLHADQELYAGAHADTIRQVMAGRGLIEAVIAVPGDP